MPCAGAASMIQRTPRACKVWNWVIILQPLWGMGWWHYWSCKCIWWVGVNIETVFWTPVQLIWLTPLRPLRLLEPLLIVWTITLSQSKTPLNLHHITCHLNQQRFSMARVSKVGVQPIIHIHSSWNFDLLAYIELLTIDWSVMTHNMLLNMLICILLLILWVILELWGWDLLKYVNQKFKWPSAGPQYSGSPLGLDFCLCAFAAQPVLPSALYDSGK